MGSHSAETNAPYAQCVDVTKSDETVFPVTRGLYVGGAGNVTVRMTDGANVLFTALAAGFHPIQCDMVLSTGTAATGIVALY